MVYSTSYKILSRWWKLIPAVALILVFAQLWSSETTPGHEAVHNIASKIIPERLPWEPKPFVPSQNPLPIESAIAHPDALGLGKEHNISEFGAEALGGEQFGEGYNPDDIENVDAGGADDAIGEERFNSSRPIADSPAALLDGHQVQFPLLNHSIHRTREADAFHDHFKTVMSLPSILMADAKATCDWPADIQPNFMVHELTDWVQNEVPDSEIDAARRRWVSFMKNDLVSWNETKGNFSGRGIVIVGGHMNSLKRIRFQLKLLKAYGSRLPVEIHYWDKELNTTEEKNVQSIYPHTTIVDLSTHDHILETFGPFMNGYHMKTNAVINSKFAEILLLDSDNVPMHDPAPLFNSETYREFGTVFWPDISRTRKNNPMWATTNTLCRMDEYEQESGQMLVDKRRFFYHLQLASFFMKEDFYRQFLLGDKDMFRFAWHALKTSFGRPSRWIAIIGTRTPGRQPFFCGRSFAQHHPDTGNNIISFLHLNAMKLMAPEVFTYFKARGGPFEYYKSPLHPDDWYGVVPAGLKSEDTSFLGIEPSRTSACLDFYEEQEIKTNKVLPDFDEFFKRLGGYDVLQDTVGG